MIDVLKGKVSINRTISSSFNDLPDDKYLKYQVKNYRQRRFSQFIYKNGKFNEIIDTKFTQSLNQNRYLGGVNRKYSPIKKLVNSEFIKILKKNFLFILESKSLHIGLHQIRIKCGKNFVGYPVPEGWHRDGFDFVAIVNIKSKNIAGGISRIRSSVSQNSDNYSCFLKTGEFIFFNDRKFYHYADPINISKNTSNGYRDTLVITFKIIK